MKLNLGENIKNYRRAMDITQEELASILGVSYQSVSRWETGVCYPDIELLPFIAELFQISIDSLLGIDQAVEKIKIEQYLKDFQSAVSVGEIEKCIEIARKGVKDYPNNYQLLNKLMYALFLSGDDDGFVPNWKENMEKYDSEIISIGERIIKNCQDIDIKLEATARLAFHHCESNRKDLGRRLYETLPMIDQSKEINIHFGLEQEELLPHYQKLIKKGHDIISQAIYVITWKNLLNDNVLLEYLEKQEKLDDIIFDGNPPTNTWGYANHHFKKAQIYARMGTIDNAITELKISVKAAKDFDNRAISEKASYTLLGEKVYSRTDFDTSDTRTLYCILKDKWLNSADFDYLGTTKEYLEIFD